MNERAIRSAHADTQRLDAASLRVLRAVGLGLMLHEVALDNWGIRNGQAASNVRFDFAIAV